MTRRGILSFLGLLVSIACLWFFFRTLTTSGSLAVLAELETRHFGALMVAAVLYAVGFICVAFAWSALMHDAPGGRIAYLRIFGVSQITRYLPGNVMHNFARFGLSVRTGARPLLVTMSMLFEVVVLCLVAVLFSASVLVQHLNLVLAPGLLAGGLALLGLGAGIALVYRKRALDYFRPVLGMFDAKRVALSLVCYCLFFLLGAAGLYVLADALHLLPVPNALLIAGAFAGSWIVGLLVPGSPAGLGPREAALVTLLAGSGDSAVAGVVALLFRAVTMAADVLLLVGALLLPAVPGRQH